MEGFGGGPLLADARLVLGGDVLGREWGHVGLRGDSPRRRGDRGEERGLNAEGAGCAEDTKSEGGV